MSAHEMHGGIWPPYDPEVVRSLGLSTETQALLTGMGLPRDCNGMFVRDPGRELHVEELPPGPAAYLGAFEDGVVTYWLLIDSDEVWMAGGCDGDPRKFALVNSSVQGLQCLLKLWESFISSGRSDEDDDYDEFVAALLDQARQADSAAFADEDAWWFNVFDEVELGVLGPQ